MRRTAGRRAGRRARWWPPCAAPGAGEVDPRRARRGRAWRQRAEWPSVQAIQPGGVAAGDQRPLVGGDVLEMLLEGLARFGPRAVRVRIVRRPEHVVQPGPMALG